MAPVGQIKNLSDSVGEIIAGHFTTAPVNLRVTTASNGLPAATNLTEGTYTMVATAACYFLQINSATTVTTLNAYYIAEGDTRDLPVTGRGPINVVAITASGSGYLQFARRNRVQ
jgi:hypothetical protein